MTVKEFEGALARRPKTRFAIVSEALFLTLDRLHKIELKQVKRDLPNAVYQTGPVLAYLRQYSERNERRVLLTYFVLAERPDVHLDCALLHRLTLDDTGPNSFVLYDGDL